MDNIRIGSLNARGIKNTKKRNAMLRQCLIHSDILLMQDTHLTPQEAQLIMKENPTQLWFNSYGTSNSKGVAVIIRKNSNIELLDDSFNDSDGRICGQGIKLNHEKFYLFSAYAPCLDASQATRINHLNFLQNVAGKMVEKRALGYQVIVGGDLNCIRDDELDSKGGHPKVYQEQSDWFMSMENTLDFHDSHRFFNPDKLMTTWAPTGPNVRGLHRRLDYIICSITILQQTKQVRTIRIPSSDHALLVNRISLSQDRTSGPGLWRHNDSLLKDDSYCKVIEDCITNTLSSTEVTSDGTQQNPKQAWEWLKYQIKQSAIKFSKRRAQAKRAEQQQLETKLAQQIMEGHEDVENTRERLARHYNELDDVIRFRSRIETAEHHERLSPFFFKQIAANRTYSNVESLKTEEQPNGTQNRSETMKVLHKHFSSLFKEPRPHATFDAGWWEDLSKLPNDVKEDLEKPITLNCFRKELFDNMSPSKAPGNDGLTVLFYRKFWHILHNPFMEMQATCNAEEALCPSQKQSVIRLIQKKG